MLLVRTGFVASTGSDSSPWVACPASRFAACRGGAMSEALPRRLAAVVFASLLQVTAAAAQDRLPPIPPEKYDDAQKKAAAEFLAVRKVPVFGPFEILMRSPELMSAARAMGDHLRFKSAIGNTLSELVILITAREWTQDYEWHVHAPIALKAGIKPEILEAIRDGRRPVGMSEDQEIIYDFCVELHRNRRSEERRVGKSVD